MKIPAKGPPVEIIQKANLDLEGLSPSGITYAFLCRGQDVTDQLLLTSKSITLGPPQAIFGSDGKTIVGLKVRTLETVTITKKP